ncbi:citrate/2-methylcitrate synthase [Sphingomonas sp. MMS24-JH45]
MNCARSPTRWRRRRRRCPTSTSPPAATRAATLPQDAPFRLFATARAVGWAAHAMEQAASGAGIRPRARDAGDR